MPVEVLLVEDDAEIRDALEEILTEEGCAVHAASSGEGALQALLQRRPPPDLILLDLILPGMTGCDFLSRKNGDPALRDIPVVVMTAAPTTNQDRRGIKGATDYLQKPFNMASLLTVLHHTRELVGRRN